jgi:hypothetical protein
MVNKSITPNREGEKMGKTLKTLVKQHNIRATSKLVDSNPNMDDMPSGSTHWKVKLRRRNNQLTVYFSMGPAHCKEPDALDVLECLLSDSFGADEPFESWCSEYGYNADSRKAERTYKIVQEQAERTKRFLGDYYDQFLYSEK